MKVVIGIPIIDGVPGEVFGSLVGLAVEVSRAATPMLVTPLNTFPHDIARSQVVKAAIEADADRYLSVDCDMLIPPGAYGRLAETMARTSAVAVAGFYYRRGWPYDPLWYRVIDGVRRPVGASEGVHELDAAGLGCMLIDLRWMRENVPQPWFEMKNFEGGILVYDDMSLCEKIRSRDGKIVGDARVRCGHAHSRVIVDDRNVDQLRRWHVEDEAVGGT